MASEVELDGSPEPEQSYSAPQPERVEHHPLKGMFLFRCSGSRWRRPNTIIEIFHIALDDVCERLKRLSYAVSLELLMGPRLVALLRSVSACISEVCNAGGDDRKPTAAAKVLNWKCQKLRLSCGELVGTFAAYSTRRGGGSAQTAHSFCQLKHAPKQEQPGRGSQSIGGTLGFLHLPFDPLTFKLASVLKFFASSCRFTRSEPVGSEYRGERPSGLQNRGPGTHPHWIPLVHGPSLPNRGLTTVLLVAIVALPAQADPCKAIPEKGPMPAYLRSGLTFTGPVVYVGDGLWVAVGQGPANWVEVRVAEFYAPELSEPDGREAKAALERIAVGRRATCIARHRSHDRVVAACSIGGQDVGDLMRRAGVREGGNGP